MGRFNLISQMEKRNIFRKQYNRNLVSTSFLYPADGSVIPVPIGAMEITGAEGRFLLRQSMLSYLLYRKTIRLFQAAQQPFAIISQLNPAPH